MDLFLAGIISSLSQLNPYKIILFGSYGTDKQSDESDIDLVVVLDKDFLPEDYNQKLDMKVEVRNCIQEQSFTKPIDLVVYTKKEYEELEILGTSFIKEIIQTGKVLYEKAS